MKILQLNCVYKKGSTGKIVYDLHSYYQNHGHDSFVIYGRGNRVREDNVYKCAYEIPSKLRNAFSRWTGNLYGSGKLATRKIIRLIKRIQPDIVHIHCMNGYCADLYMLLGWLKNNRIATMLTLHAEFMYTGNCGYAFDCEQWKTGSCSECSDILNGIGSINQKAPERNFNKMRDAFLGFDDNLRVVGVSDWISARARESKILSRKEISTVMNGLDVDVFTYRDVPHSIIEKYHNENKKVVLHVTPYFEDSNKGGAYVLKLASMMRHLPVQFVVVGTSYEKYDLPNVTFIGKVSDQAELSELYSNADVCLLTSKRETFSMVCAETLCCGTPIVGFCAGAPETIALPKYSKFVEYGNTEELKNALQDMLSKNLDKQSISKEAHSVYAKSVMAENNLKVYKELLQRMDLK